MLPTGKRPPESKTPKDHHTPEAMNKVHSDLTDHYQALGSCPDCAVGATPMPTSDALVQKPEYRTYPSS